MVIEVFIDGACPGNGRNATTSGYGVYYPGSQYPNKSVRCQAPHTNNRAELSALIDVLHTSCMLEYIFDVYCDSDYVVGIYNGYYKGKKNQDLLRQVVELKNTNVRVIKCLAHTGNTDLISIGNAKADKLAIKACKKSNLG